MATDVLAGLKDIHLPEAVSIWPLGVGWYIVAVITLFVIVLLILFLIRKLKSYRRKRAILRLFNDTIVRLEKENPEGTIAGISIFLKQVAINELKIPNIHLCFGESWITFLDQAFKSSDFSQGAGRLFLGVYAPQLYGQKDIEALKVLSKKWLRKVL